MPFIEIANLTKDYGRGRGIFDLSLSMEQGEAFGYVGTNGAGKTTTIRHLMGFIRPQKGVATIGGLDCWKDSAQIKRRIGYVPGEIAFPDASNGLDFLKRQAELAGLKDLSRMHQLLERLQLDPTANLKRMSKGMKQKTAIVAALMTDPDILILDEPTTGLDPLMRAIFMDLMKQEKQRGKTIFMSSHLFEEVEQLCDKVGLIKDGRLLAVKATSEILHNENKVYQVDFHSAEEYRRFLAEPYELAGRSDTLCQVKVKVHDRQINAFIRTLNTYDLKSFAEIKYTLRDYFRSLY